MDLGTFSISLTVKDLVASRAFYEKLGFSAIGGDGEGWLILGNGRAVVGLFQGMFDKNILTFTPGLDPQGRELATFTDVREIRSRLGDAGLAFEEDTTGKTDSGPAHLILVDPDGNPIFIDQHV